MEDITSADIQAQRREERLTTAMETAPVAKKQIAALRAKSDALAAEAEVTEAAQVQAFNEAQALAQARVATTLDLNELRQFQAAADSTDAEVRVLAVRLLAANRSNDVYGKTNFLLGLDSIARLLVLKPLLPGLIGEKKATIERLDEQIAKLDSSQ